MHKHTHKLKGVLGSLAFQSEFGGKEMIRNYYLKKKTKINKIKI